MRTDRQTDMTKLTAALRRFCERAQKLKKIQNSVAFKKTKQLE